MTVDRVIVPSVDPSLVASEGLRIAVDSYTEQELDSIFPRLGRNDRCHCGSGDKYKVCHLLIDQEAWRIVAGKIKQAEAACALLRPYPSSEPLFENPEFDQ